MTTASRRSWSRFLQIAKPYFVSTAGRRAFGLVAALLALLLGMSALNVVNSYINRDFMTSIADREPYRVWWLALIYLGVFAASTAVGALSRFVELLLGLRWREWLTRYFIHRYLTGHAYYRLNKHSEVDNPDQRISEDVKTFTTCTLSFLILVTQSVITVIAFFGVLWSITPWLCIASVLYPVVGTWLIVFVGRRLVNLNNLQLKKEADFRFELVDVRENAQSIALVKAEKREEARLGIRLDALVANYRVIITVLGNLKFVTGGYNYLTQLIPVLIVAPLYLRGEVEFGVITQAMMAFSQVFNAFSLIAEQFQDLSTFAAVVVRLDTLGEAITHSTEPSQQAVHVVEEHGPVSYQGVTLRTPENDRILVRNLHLEVQPGRRILVMGPNGAGKSALFQATAGLWNKGTGRILRPTPGRIQFLPERPYMVPGTLRDQLFTTYKDKVPDERVLRVLNEVRLEALVGRVGGLDVEHDWRTTLSLGEQQLIAFARLLLAEPEFAFLDEAASALSERQRADLYQLLARTGITYVSVGDCQSSLLESHDTLLELHSDGTWTAGPVIVGQN
jgi:putative ATP-binding cassette transporter